MILIIVKVCSMVFMFLIIVVVGTIPIRAKAFQTNELLLSITASFSGGLFLSVGLLHLLPEAEEGMAEYHTTNGDSDPQFPYVFLTLILSFSVMMWIEKIAYGSHDHHHHPHHAQVVPALSAEQLTDVESQDNQKPVAPLTPYFLLIAMGTHAVFEGLAIGIQNDYALCLGIALVVLCHKWAEGLTLGLAFKQANVDFKRSILMICLQAMVNPIGIGIGWILSSEGSLVTSVFQAISAGTFLYIATFEVLVEEFSNQRFRGPKYGVYLIAIGFVSSLWFVEQELGG